VECVDDDKREYLNETGKTTASSPVECVDSKKDYHEDDLAAVKEFMFFIAKIKTRFPGHDLAHQFSNYPEELECRFRLARKTDSTGGRSDFLLKRGQHSHEVADEQK
jgi:hypothetical protein